MSALYIHTGIFIFTLFSKINNTLLLKKVWGFKNRIDLNIHAQIINLASLFLNAHTGKSTKNYRFCLFI